MSGIDKLLDRLRDVGNLHEFAELFDFSWHDDTDWTWHDVAVRMADEIEAELCGSVDRSRWNELFGTPERAAWTLHSGGTLVCRECLIREGCAETPEDSKCMIAHYDALLEWLKEETK